MGLLADPLVFSPFLILGVSLLVGLLIYLWGRAMAPPPSPGGHKREMYVGGEAPPAGQNLPSYHLYHVAVFFTLLHVAVLVLGTAPSGPGAWAALLYLGILSLAVVALVWRQ